MQNVEYPPEAPPEVPPEVDSPQVKAPSLADKLKNVKESWL